jgi:hypothetical protein
MFLLQGNMCRNNGLVDTQSVLFSLLSHDVLAAAHALAPTSFSYSSPSSYSLNLFSFVCKMLGAEKETNMCSPSSCRSVQGVDEEGLGVNDLFNLYYRPCNPFATIISSLSVVALNKSQISLYITHLS